MNTGNAGFRLVRNRRVTSPQSVREAAATVIPQTAVARARQEIPVWPNYRPTPLVELPGLAGAHDLSGIWYKDEGSRLGVGSFKPLGGGYAVSRIVARFVADHSGRQDVAAAAMLTGKYRELSSRITVTCATDGNHGRAVAWAAKTFGCRAVVYMAKVVSPHREQAIRSLGAEVVSVSGNHEEASAVCHAAAQENGWFVVSETENATVPEIAQDTLSGYVFLFNEARTQLGSARPSHLFIQAGVGGLAAAATLWAATHWPDDPPRLVVVETNAAACIFESIAAGEPRIVEGDLETIMAGLAAGEVSGNAWPLLEQGAYAAMAIADEPAIEAMRLLATAPYGDDPIVGGESGVAGLAAALLGASQARDQLGLDSHSRVFVVGTEGATDPDVYRRLVGIDPSDLI